MKNNKHLGLLKERTFEYCKDFAASKIARLGSQIKELENALTTETKSSAGDKHETGRAMVQLEREKLGVQLAQAEKTQQLIHKVKLSTPNKFVTVGSLVVTSGVVYFISISAGKYHESGTDVYCISAGTPIGQLLLGKCIGETVQFNQNDFKILDIR